MPTIQRSVTIAVPPQRVYETFVDLSTWAHWNPHLRKLTPLSEGRLAPGSRVRVAVKLDRARVWEVTNIEPGRSFTWESNLLPGVHVLFDRIAEPEGQGTRATFRIVSSGPLGFLGTTISPAIATTWSARSED